MEVVQVVVADTTVTTVCRFRLIVDHLSFIRRDQNKEERKREKKRMNE